MSGTRRTAPGAEPAGPAPVSAVCPEATVHLIDTPHGPARAHRYAAHEPVGTLVLSHGAGGRDWSRDLLALAELSRAGSAGAVGAGAGAVGIGPVGVGAVGADSGGAAWEVVLVEQPWRVAGRKVAAPPRQLDAAWLAVLAALRAAPHPMPGPWVVGGRSAGARVACRTAGAVGADAVLALAFPLHPPGRPERSRAAELAGVGVPTLVVQGVSDPFGTAEQIRAAVPGVPVSSVRGGHGFSADVGDVVAAVRGWLVGLRPGPGNAPGAAGR